MCKPGKTPSNAHFSLSVRDTVVLLLALLAGTGAAILMRIDGVSLSQAVLGGAGALALSLKFFDKLLRC